MTSASRRVRGAERFDGPGTWSTSLDIADAELVGHLDEQLSVLGLAVACHTVNAQKGQKRAREEIIDGDVRQQVSFRRAGVRHIFRIVS